MVTEYIGGDFNDASPAQAAARAIVTADNAHETGSTDDIARITLALDSDKKAQAAFGARLAEASVAHGASWKFITYVTTLMTTAWPAEEEARNILIHSQIAGPLLKLLSARKDGLARTLDEIADCMRAPMRQPLLDRTLRAAANNGQTDVVRTLLAAGADAQADGSRALLNALIADKLDCAHILREHGADTASARKTAALLKYDNDKNAETGLATGQTRRWRRQGRGLLLRRHRKHAQRL